MNYVVSIKRQKNKDSRPYSVTLHYESDGNESVATMLENLNMKTEDKIQWQCSCLQKKCGACAMVINRVPRLACSTFLRDLGTKISLEPLSKFPVVRDLMVDRQPVYQQLKENRLWNEDGERGNSTYQEQMFKAAACIMCGCCLEVCPNFAITGKHLGGIGVVASYRLRMSEVDGSHKVELKSAYEKTVYNTCGKSLSCMDICPVHLPIEELMVRNNNL